MKYVYTAVFEPEPSKETVGKMLYNVSFPDLDCHTCGESLNDAICMARDVLCLHLYHMEQEGKPIPVATPPQAIKVITGAFVSAIDVDTEFYKRFYDNKAVRKSITIPAWLNAEAEKSNVNFSQTLQTALKEKLQLVNTK